MICRIIVLYVSFNTQSGGFLFTILNALVWYVYINALGVGNNGLKSNKLKWLVIVIAILLVLSGFGYFSIEFEFNFWFFNWTRLGLSSENGIWFFWLNTLIWFPLYFITFIVESEVSN